MTERPAAPEETVRFDGAPGGARLRPDVPVPAAPRTSEEAAAPTPTENPAVPRASAQPAAHAAPPVGPPEDFEDTRPVPRNWLRGAPEDAAAEEATPEDTGPPEANGPASAAAPAVAAPGSPDDDGTQRIPVPGADYPTERYAPSAATAALPAPPTQLPDGSTPPVGDPMTPEAPAQEGSSGNTAPPTGHGPRPPWWRRRAALIPAGVLGLLTVLYGTDLAVSAGEVPRSTLVAGVDIGGLSPTAAATALERDLAPRIAADHAVVADDVETTFSPAAAGIALDVEATVDAADDQPVNPWTRLVSLFGDRRIAAVTTGEETALAAQLETIAGQVDRAPVDATIEIEGTTPRLVEPVDGRTLDRDGAGAAVSEALASGVDPATPIRLPVDADPVRVTTEEAQRVLDETVTPALAAPVGLRSEDGEVSTEIPVEATAASLTFTPQDSGELAVAIDPERLQEALGDELADFSTPAEDARFEVSGGGVEVVPSKQGTGIDPAQLAEQLLPVLNEPAPRSVTAELGPVEPELTTEEAKALGIKEEISSFTTRFTNPASGTNIRVVAEEVDGALVLPGETFSLNTFTGPRGTAQGYVESMVISGGELSKAVGGGISQFATTMFNAVFFAGLEDVYHKPHSFYISRYPAGREATVYEGAIDLQWRNDSETGVLVDTQWRPGSLTVTFYGTKRYEIESVSSPRRNHREPAEQERVDDGDCIPQSGVPGFDVTVTRIFRDLETGAEVKREDFVTSYAAEAVIRCVPPKDDDDNDDNKEGETREGETREGETREGETREGETREGETREDETREGPDATTPSSSPPSPR